MSPAVPGRPPPRPTPTSQEAKRWRLTVVVVADVPHGAEAGFQAYESAVLPLLPRHGGRLERRLRTADARSEVHLVSFASQEGFEAYLADEERQSHRGLLDGLGVAQRVLLVQDVPTAEA